MINKQRVVLFELNREYLTNTYIEDKLLELTVLDENNYNRGSKIVSIALETFNGLRKLEKLSLSNNEIEKLEGNVFEGLSNLLELNLNKNKLKRIDSNTFKGLVKLERLFLEDNEISEISDKAFESLSNLKNLYLPNNKLTRINSNTFKGIGEKLEGLILSYNEITEIEAKSFENFFNLKNLILVNNKLRVVDSNTFKGLKNLEKLSLAKNEIEEFKVDAFEGLFNLKELWLNNNSLKRIDSNTFKDVTELETLSFRENEIEEIESKSFEHLSNLKELRLSNNKLKRIDPNTFKGLEKLKRLELDYNEIEEIDDRLFYGLLNLKLLFLNNNRLKRIDKECFEPLKSIKLIQLFDNQIKILSFFSPSTKLFNSNYYKNKLDANGFHSNWDTFLEHIHSIGYKFRTPKLLIVDYYDSVISDIDIITEELFEKYNEDEVFKIESNNNNSGLEQRSEIEKFFENEKLIDPYSDEYKYDTDLKITLESGKIHDYLNLVRLKAIEEVKNVRDENLEHYELNKAEYKYNRNDLTAEKVEEIRRELFKEKFCFLLRIDDILKETELKFKCVIVITDFYLDTYDQYKLLKLFDLKNNDMTASNETIYRNKNTYLLYLLWKYICGLLNKQMHEVISVTKEKLFNIERLKALDNNIISLENCDFSKLKSLDIQNSKRYDVRRLNDLSNLANLEYLYISDMIIQLNAFNGLKKLIKLSLENCHLDGNTLLSNDSKKLFSSLTNLQILEVSNLKFPINVESLENLKILIFNSVEDFDLLENLGNRFIGLSLSLLVFYTSNYRRIVSKNMDSFLKRHNFENVAHLRLSQFDKDFNPRWLKSFANLKRLSLSACALNETNLNFLRSEISLSKIEYLNLRDNSISAIKNGTFSKLKKLKYLDISCNKISFQTDSYFDKTCFRYILPTSSNKNVFSGLGVLKTLDLSQNDVKYIDPEVFANTPKLAHLNLRRNECKLEERTFCRLKCLEKIEFEQSDLDKIDSSILDNLRRTNVEIIIN